MKTETIAAIATAASNSGIGIVRLSGEEAFKIADRIFRPKHKRTMSSENTHTIHYGHIYDGEELLDEVLVMLMKGPHSYTGEDTIEINCHGGVLMVRRILDTVVRYGARPAEPGEFTKRAFLNGKMDLSQAEAVIDVINAQNQYALKSSVSQLNGSMSRRIRKMREEIIYHIAYIESALDDPEHISLEGYSERLMETAYGLADGMKCLMDTRDRGRVMIEGIRTVILGKPNVGKSSLMNVLVGEERAIVTEIAGTTRDTLEETIRLEGISLNVIDTAGIRSTDDVVEKIGVLKARDSVERADLIIYVVDASRSLDENDEEIIQLIEGKKAVIILNKTDLKIKVSKGFLEIRTGCKVIPISVKEETGIQLLEEEIKSMFYQGDINFNDEIYITNARHQLALEESYRSMNLVIRSIEDGMPEDFYSIDLMNAFKQLGTVIGEAVEDDLVNEIFSKFCTGK